ncbi:MAG: excinuclease subunit UvrA [Pseudomonadota bacterium]
MAELQVRGAREHNLKNISVALPRDALVVITGPSGSGKSSLAFDTIYAEAERRYVESLSVYARQYLGQMPKPDVDGIDGLSPAISVRQQSGPRSPRSTVGTITEIYDYLRLLFARVGVAHSPHTGAPMRAYPVQAVVERALSLPEETRLTIAAPVTAHADESLPKLLGRLGREGFVRVVLDGVVHDLGDELSPADQRAQRVAVQIDRVRIKPAARARISEAVELAYRVGDGRAELTVEGGETLIFCEQLRCVSTGERFPELSPRVFSFNTPEGACATCGGLASVLAFEVEQVVPDAALSLRQGAIAPWGTPDGPYYQQKLEELVAAVDVDLDKAWSKLPKAQQKRVLGDGAKRPADPSGFDGVLPELNRRARDLARRKGPGAGGAMEALQYIEEDLLRYAREVPCTECRGSRLSAFARHVRVGDSTLPELVALPLGELARFIEECSANRRLPALAERILRDIASRVAALITLGLEYVSIDRAATTLSGGELQRIRLATQIGAGLVGVLYVLDEPSAGLHARDNERLIRSLQALVRQGNTVLVVEHDDATIRAAQHVVDLGEGAGVRGGCVMAVGSPEQLAADARSLTGAYLAGRKSLPVPAARRVSQRYFGLDGATRHNLSDFSCRFPVGALSCVTGVSGSGKSTLVSELLLPAVKAALRGKGEAPLITVVGAEAFDRIIDVDQAPIGRTPRSSPASYLGILDELRELFATLPEAKARGYTASRFSFNVKGGRCEACKGDGVTRVDMQFLPDAFVRCEVCAGRRYNRETLDITYRGLSIADVLERSGDEARLLFQAIPKLASKLDALCDVGLGYVSLGQAANTLSGGEAQRVKLARELARRTTGRTLLVLDEPTTGLHAEDVALLVVLLSRLVDAGNTVLVVEHHLDFVKCADFVLDMGPEAGPRGGRIVAQGTPEQVAQSTESITAPYLREALSRARAQTHR